MRISDEIRVWCDEADVDGNACYELRELARRIDYEMAELPKDADGVPIHVGDTVYLESGSKADIKSIEFSQDEHSIVLTARGKVLLTEERGKGFLPSHLYHERPDSLERIANELDEWRVAASFDCRIKAMDEDIVHDLADRIRKLAKEGE